MKLAEGWRKALLTVVHTGLLRSLPCLNLFVAGKTVNFATSIGRQY